MMEPVLLHVARAAELGIAIKGASEEKDRVPEDHRVNPCPPTCDDGILTISHPRRCRECTKEGL